MSRGACVLGMQGMPDRGWLGMGGEMRGEGRGRGGGHEGSLGVLGGCSLVP